jgi:hypothetical protein
MEEAEKETKVVVNNIPITKKSKRRRFASGFSSNYIRALLVIVCFGIIGGVLLFVRAASTSYNLFPSNPIPKTITVSSSNSVELGVKFKSADSGYVTGVRFYKGAQNTGTHIGTLWDGKGDQLASVTFSGETNSGWQQANFAQPVAIAANVVYVVSYLAPNGHYSLNNNFFSSGSYVSGPLTALANGTSQRTANGVYMDTNSPAFPTRGMHGANFWVDLVFSTNLVSPPVAPAPPTSVNAVVSESSVIVSWNAGISAEPITSYYVFRNGTQIATVSGTTLSYTDTALTSGTTYSYQIKTFSSGLPVSALSEMATVTYNANTTTCPVGDTGTPPNCVAPTCPVGDTGTPPNCVAPTCPVGDTGTPPNCIAPPSTGGTPTSVWTPSPTANWQWVLTGTFSTTNAADMGTGVTAYSGAAADPTIFDIDGILNSGSTVQAIHALGDKAICYIEVGTAGNYYSASDEGISTTYFAQLQAAGDLSTNQLQGYPEYFININEPSAISIIESMIDQQCAAKGFDGVETDLDETLNNNEGTTPWTITTADEEAYLTTLANYMHSLNLAWIAKNLDDTGDTSFVDTMEPLAQGMISEESNYYGTTALWAPFETADKWIGNAEYTSDGETTAKFCPADNAVSVGDVNGVLFNVNLDASTYEPCR